MANVLPLILLAGAAAFAFSKKKSNEGHSSGSIWLYRVVEKIPNAGPFEAWVQNPSGEAIHLPDTYFEYSGAEEAAKQYIVDHGGTPKMFEK